MRHLTGTRPFLLPGKRKPSLFAAAATPARCRAGGCSSPCPALAALTLAACGDSGERRARARHSDAALPRDQEGHVHGRVQGPGQPALRRRLRGPGEGLLSGAAPRSRHQARTVGRAPATRCWPARSRSPRQTGRRCSSATPRTCLSSRWPSSASERAGLRRTRQLADPDRQGLGGQDLRLQRARSRRSSWPSPAPTAWTPPRSSRSASASTRASCREGRVDILPVFFSNEPGVLRPHGLQDPHLRSQRLRRSNRWD